MKTKTYLILFWTPRILCLLFSVFISLFALDVFQENSGLWKTTLALLIHLIPAFLIIIVLILSWKWEWVGGITFILLGILYIILMPNHPAWWIFIAGPLFLISIFFFAGWFYKKKLINESSKK